MHVTGGRPCNNSLHDPGCPYVGLAAYAYNFEVVGLVLNLNTKCDPTPKYRALHPNPYTPNATLHPKYLPPRPLTMPPCPCHQDLVDDGAALVPTPASTPCCPQGVKLVDEQDGGSKVA